MALSAAHFSRTKYDTCYYPENVYDSTSPFSYIVDSSPNHNLAGCITEFGPRPSRMGPVNSLSGHVVAAAQANIDVDSVMSNRNVPLSRCKRGKVNPIDITKIKTNSVPVCSDKLDWEHTKMTHPSMFYRGAAINRFYDLNKDPQANIYYDWSVNTVLEMKDNYVPHLPHRLTEVDIVPNGRRDMSWEPKVVKIRPNANCGNRPLR